MGRVFDLTAHATPTPSELSIPPLRGKAEWIVLSTLGRLRSHVVVAIQLDQWVNDQTAIQTTKNDGTGRHRRLALLNHQAFAFLTGHGVPPPDNDDPSLLTLKH